jgi:hypothetical protein
MRRKGCRELDEGDDGRQLSGFDAIRRSGATPPL